MDDIREQLELLGCDDDEQEWDDHHDDDGQQVGLSNSGCIDASAHNQPAGGRDGDTTEDNHHQNWSNWSCAAHTHTHACAHAFILLPHHTGPSLWRL
jgi:hypothetical protein